MRTKSLETTGVITEGTLAGFKEGTTLKDVAIATYNEMPASFREAVSIELFDDLPNFAKVMYEYDPNTNAFFYSLLNRIGRVNINYRMFRNPLSVLKKGMLEFGDTIEDIYIDPVKAELFTNQADNSNAGDLWQNFKSKIAKCYYSINKQFVYPFSISTIEASKAFVSWDALDRFIGGKLNAAYQGDNIDDFHLSIKCLADYGNVDGANNYYQIHVDDVTDETTAKAFVKAVRGAVSRLKFPSRKYNHLGVMNMSEADNLFLFVTPEVMAHVDVDVLARAFNMDKATLMGRVTEIPDFGGLADTVAILVDEEFFQIWDTFIAMKSTGENAYHLFTNYFLHHQGIFATSPLYNAIQFTTADIVTPTTVAITGEASVTKGTTNIYTAQVTDGASGKIATQTVEWSVADDGTDPNGSQYISIDQTGALYISPKYEGAKVTITAESVEKEGVKITKDVTVS